MKKQVIVIGGGTAFDSYDDYLEFLHDLAPSLEYLKQSSWKDVLQERVGGDYDVVRLQMPCKMNAKYEEWKIYFEKFIPLFEEEVILIGHSLGAIFLAKYLSENEYPGRIIATFLLAAPYDDESKESLGDFKLQNDLSELEQQSGVLTFYQSKDDLVVLFDEVKKYQAKLPHARYRIFENKLHFNDEEFPELVEDIKRI